MANGKNGKNGYFEIWLSDDHILITNIFDDFDDSVSLELKIAIDSFLEQLQSIDKLGFNLKNVLTITPSADSVLIDFHSMDKVEVFYYILPIRLRSQMSGKNVWREFEKREINKQSMDKLFGGD